MKSILIGLLIIVGISFFTLKAQQLVQEKKYKLELTQQQWAMRLNYIEAAKQIMDKSVLPANAVSQWKDSLDVFAREINEQVGAQLQLERNPPAKPVVPKKDSAKGKN